MKTRIAIIGSGFSAAAALSHLARAGWSCRDITVVGPGALGAGQAYGSLTDHFRLNVRPNLMRLWPDDETHFEEWAARRITDPNGASTAGHFYPRQSFARYMTEQLEAIEDFDTLRLKRHRVSKLVPAPDEAGEGWALHIEDGSVISAKCVVVATGNPEPVWPLAVQPDADAPGLVSLPWCGRWVERIPARAHVAVIGAGLTAMDAVYALWCHKHRGKVTIVAPHGMTPPAQTDWTPREAFDWPVPLRGSGFLRAMRDHLGRGDWNDVGWQERFEQLRVHINDAWRGLPEEDRVHLARRLGWLWSLLRFRAGPHAVAALDQMQHSAQAELVTGRLVEMTVRGTGWALGIASRSAGQAAGIGRVEADIVVNCTGMGRDPLLVQMMDDGVVAPTMVAGRPKVDSDLRMYAPSGTPHATLYLIGPATGHDLGDVVGSTSIARQAEALATGLASAKFQG